MRFGNYLKTIKKPQQLKSTSHNQYKIKTETAEKAVQNQQNNQWPQLRAV